MIWENCAWLALFRLQTLLTLTAACRWAWHNSHLTRKIAKEERITPAGKPTKPGRKRPSRPRTNLGLKLANLHLLLRAPGFARWPLQVHFFCEDVYEEWQTSCKKATERLREGIEVVMNEIPPSELTAEERNPRGSKEEKARKKEEGIPKQAALNLARISSLDISYNALKCQITQSLELNLEGSTTCGVCDQVLESEDSTLLVCPQPNCGIAFHIACLARTFLDNEQEVSVLPTSGNCPNCSTRLQWIDLVKELSLRTRGAKELDRLLKKPRSRRTRTKNFENELSSQIVVEETDDDDDEEVRSNESDEGKGPGPIGYEESLPDDWHQPNDDDDAMSATSIHSTISSTHEHSSPHQSRPGSSRLKAVIEESDWDGAEVLD